MILTINAVESLSGDILLPSSKSYSIRALMIAACGGRSVIRYPSNCDDALVAMKTARALGANINPINKHTIKIDAMARPHCLSEVNVKESGTVLRFVLPLVSLYEEDAVIVGEGTLCSRPNLPLIQTLRQLGVSIRGKGSRETVPIQKKQGRLQGGKISIDGSLSSQFVSAFLIAAARLTEDSWIYVRGKKVVSLPYITMTRQILKTSGISVIQKSSRIFFVKGGQKFKGLENFTVPSDYGLAAFLLGAGALVPSKLTLKGFFSDKLIQADGMILEFLKKMGVHFEEKKNAIQIAGPFDLKGGNFSLKDCPDLVPIMAVLALFAKGRTRLYNIGHAKIKESDRIGDLKKEFLKIGAQIEDKSDEMVIYPQNIYRRNCLLNPHRDHRLAMAFAVLGLRIGARVSDIECTAKSYPDFVKDLGRLKIPLSLSV